MEMRDIMSKIAILTDSSCDIPQEMAEKYGIDIMSFHILLDDVDYVERESCTNTEFYDKMRAAKGVPSTAAITPIQFCEKYCQYVDEAIRMSFMYPSTNPALPPTITPSWHRGCCGKSARSTT
mgnify:FL=1